MRVSRKQVEENKQTILAAAGRLFRERGFDAVTVTDIMKSAGLTHGGFYGYFKSKDELIALTLAELKAASGAVENGSPPQIERYLSPEHRDNFASGCPLAGAGGRHHPPVRAGPERNDRRAEAADSQSEQDRERGR
ncbi:Potential acrAB operon repressor [Raoultella terrigena]|uniref:Potential acrAB operon repressor n=1 Tax=Raoultella terrigena TaxID=577 RepID=A0A4U9CYN3_RAOTE|nr:Potential acrAB operon repressor [Raoultella terrigena]